MNKYQDILKGGDLRSIGNANKISKRISTQKEFDELFECLYHSDRKVVMRAADAIEKITAGKAGFLQIHKTALLKLCQAAVNIELKWHLALLVSRLKFTDKEFAKTWDLLLKWAADKTESKIVRVNSIQGLYNMARQKRKLLPVLQLALAEIKKENAASLNARIKKLESDSLYR